MKPGQTITTITSKSGKEIVIRAVSLDDSEKLRKFINTVSKEDTYVSFSGEQLTRKEEESYVKEIVQKMQNNNILLLLAFDNDELVATSSVERILRNKTRAHHVGIMGLIVKKEYRKDGIGRKLFEKVIELARTEMELKLVTLNKFEPNSNARKLYESLGFVECGRLPGGYLYRDNYVDNVMMYKTLW